MVNIRPPEPLTLGARQQRQRLLRQQLHAAPSAGAAAEAADRAWPAVAMVAHVPRVPLGATSKKKKSNLCNIYLFDPKLLHFDFV